MALQGREAGRSNDKQPQLRSNSWAGRLLAETHEEMEALRGISPKAEDAAPSHPAGLL